MLPAPPNSGDSAPPHDSSSSAAAATVAASDLGSSGFSEDERGRNEDAAVGRNSGGGNRWPRQETLYLLKIRSDMDAVFRDSSLKGPLWEEVSRKLASLGFHRSAKKCKEKFENVYKYHKRIKEGRGSKSDGKTYKFFEQLEALETTPATGVHQQPPLSSLPLPPPPSMSNAQIQSVPVVTPVSMTVTHQNNVDPISVAAPAVAMPPMNVNRVGRFPFSQLNLSASSGSSSYETSEDEPPERRRNRKRKWKEFFGKLMKEVIDKQEELQSKFLDTLERRERDRTAREEAWRMQEMAKMKREYELLVQERSMIAAKDAAVITFLQKITDQNPPAVAGITQIPAMQLLQQQQQNRPSTPAPTPTPASIPPMQQQSQSQPPQPFLVVPVAAAAPTQVPVPISESVPVSVLPPPVVKNLDSTGGEGEAMQQPSPSRWPKAEINALIQIRTSLDTKYQETGPKGPLWEEVSVMMRNLGYNRNAKRCKEKWENINKYYKKVKESSKRRPEDSKTCPYFHQLDAIYREKASGTSSNNNSNIGLQVKPEAQMAPIMARPEQQWPLPSMLQEQQQQRQYQHHQQLQQQQQSKVNEPRGNDDQHNTDLNDDDYDDVEDEDDDVEDEEGGDYEVVQNKTSSMAAV